MEGKVPLRVLGATAYPVTAASARVRLVQFAPFLRGHGIELKFRPALTPEEYALLVSRSSPSRKAAVLATGAFRAISRPHEDGLLLVHRLRLLNPLPLIDPPRHLDAYDFDDALFDGSAAPINRRFQWAKQEAARAIASVRRARLVIAGNPFLADQARGHNRRVEVVPSCVDPDTQPLHTHEAKEVMTIGWIGSHTTSPYLASILPVLERMNRKAIRARLLVIGGALAYQAPWLEQRPWSLQTQARDLAEFDIGVMPLPDTPWARGKCGYKLLQYFAAGVPAVASPVGMTADLLDGQRGVLATTQQEWERALYELMCDAVERAERGAAARRFVEDEYSYRRWAPRLAQLLRRLQ